MSLKSEFHLRPDITYLNFGSFGACPKPVFKVYQEQQLLLEQEPVQFMAVYGPRAVKQSREDLGMYVDCDADDIVFTPNPTHAINIVANSLDLQPGDEVLSTDIEYGAMDRTWKYFCNKKKAVFVRRPVSLPVNSSEEIIENFWKGVTKNTKVIFLSHITSATAMILPVEEICRKAKANGIITIVDGAHVPGHIPLSIRKLDVDFYTGACHKWMMTPKGSSFLYVRKSFQELLQPLIVSWGYESEKPSGSVFQDWHQFNGTRDFSAYLTIRASIDFMKKNNWESVGSECRKIVIGNAARFCELAGTKPITPLTTEFLGQMFSIPVNTKSPLQLQESLFKDYKIEIPVMKQDGRTFLRYSINGFNSQQDLDVLYNALKKLLDQGQLITKALD